MNIEQMLRDAIERKTAEILKEEYGIEPSKQVMDETSNEDDPDEDDSDREDYQVRLTNVGDYKIRVVKVVHDNIEPDLKTAKSLVDYAPQILASKLTWKRATDIAYLLSNAGATANVEKTTVVLTTKYDDSEPEPAEVYDIPTFDLEPSRGEVLYNNLAPEDEKSKSENDEPNKNWRYQVVLETIGRDPERIARIITDFTHDEKRTQAFMDAVPVAIHRGLIVDSEIAIRNSLLTCGADAYVEKMIKID
jgi:large subunit ribosomal protein L7/L12